jgi:uncharacterized protein YqjF (DUF2071 family)
MSIVGIKKEDKLNDLLHHTHHRPYDLPAGKWVYYQEWNDAVFLHWRVDREALRALVPRDLELDLHEGQAWVSVVAFNMEKIRPRALPPFAPVSNFYEINIRTYVRHKGKGGVYFLSIEGGKRLSCSIARAVSGLPYRFSEINRRENELHAQNQAFGDRLEIQYRIGSPQPAKSALDLWLTERYALFQDSPGAIYEFDIHHIEWPVFEIDLLHLAVAYPRFQALWSGPPDAVHYSPGVQVLAWGRRGHARQEG